MAEIAALFLFWAATIAFLARITQTKSDSGRRRWVIRFRHPARGRLKTKFEIELTVLEDGIVILKPVGELEGIVSGGEMSPFTPSLRFRRAILDQLKRGHKWMIIECSEIRRIDDVGFAETVSCWARVAAAGGEMVLVCDDEFQKLFITLMDSPHCFRTIDEAVRYLRTIIHAE